MNTPKSGFGQVQHGATEMLETRVQRLEARLAAIVQADGSITLNSQRKVEINVSGNTLVIDSSGISLRGHGRLELVNSNKVVIHTATADITASQVRLNSGLVSATGIVKTPTLQATNVIASSYSPGAGNIM